MRTATVAITLLSAIIPAAIAAPQGNFIQLQITGKSNISSVAYGEQIQGTDQSNHWVVWIEGKSACPPLQVLGSLVTSPCNTTFQLPGEADNRKSCPTRRPKSTTNPV
ncbi:hypothetical protein F5Y12DRAFT_725203 [Xylaria sp. FL1777]|nr:hypothetical protein F5Y12DRAFT_725203 [Xylaria sp. FL1777]